MSAPRRGGSSPGGLALGVKICGVTSPEDAALAVSLGARAIGLNFHPPSPRFVTLAAAAAIAGRVRGKALVAGVFVNRLESEIAAIDAAVGLDLIQLHGDEGAAEVERWGERALRVFRCRSGMAPPPFASYPQAGFLFDVYREEAYGGTGEAWDWAAVAGLAVPRPYFVAGGIRPGNARRALAESGAGGLDVCSGVETAPGKKDPHLLERLMREVHDAG